MTAWQCIAACFPVPSSLGEGAWKLCHRCWQLRWQQDHPALAVLCVYGGENVSVLSSREDQDTKTVSLLAHSVLLRRSLHPGQRVSLVGAAGRCGYCCRASPAASDLKSSDCLQGLWFRSAWTDEQWGGDSACGLCITTNHPQETGNSW